jgi:hypothetical protein
MSVDQRLAYIEQVIADVASDSSISDYARRQRLEELHRAKRLAEGELAQQERGARDWEQLKDRVRADMAEKAEARQAAADAVAAMSPVQVVEHLERLRSRPAPVYEPLRPFWGMARQEIEAEDAQEAARERERHEAELGLPRMQAEWQKRSAQIGAKASASADQARADLEEALRAVNENEQRERDDLGECPTLESIEVTV